MIVLNKPAFINSEELERVFQGTFLLHRLDRETSGVLLLGKDRDFQKEVIETFKKREVYKEYVAWVSGKLIEPVEISKRIAKEKKRWKGSECNFSKRGRSSYKS
jgi:23S rRNA pseudouridine1911/1915/1917 synthase